MVVMIVMMMMMMIAIAIASGDGQPMGNHVFPYTQACITRATG